MLLPALVILGLLGCALRAQAECANACNGHGKCTSYDMCICHRNWQANDCSERVCAFGRAHVDSPKGDLNGDGIISNADIVVVDNSFIYPYGTSEQFPQMRDSALIVDTNTAHDYMECSNKGECDRTTGICSCYDGYDGVACQRASCPGFPSTCSGHGICRSINQLARMDNDNVYLLWDKNVTMGCSCDPGFYGPDCSLKSCKYGLDPLYLDDATTIKYAAFDLAVVATCTASTYNLADGISKADGSNADFYDFWSQGNPGKFAIRFYDNVGKAWLTDAITAGASCAEVVAALEALPNNAVPRSTVLCTQSVGNFKNELSDWNSAVLGLYDAQHNATSSHKYRLTYQMAFWEAYTTDAQIFGQTSVNSAGSNVADPTSGAAGTAYSVSQYAGTGSGLVNPVSLSGSIYRLKFTGNPGVFAQPEIETYLDGNTRQTLKSRGGQTITKVWTDGQQGEYNDYSADHCDGVSVTIASSLGAAPTYPLSSATFKTSYSYLAGLTALEVANLKTCLGDADGIAANNVELANWQYGTTGNPHLIKLVRSVTTYLDGGYYAAVYFNAANNACGTPGGGCFQLLNPFLPPDLGTNDGYEVYTTTGVLQAASATHQTIFNFGSPYAYTMNLAADQGLSADTGDLSCVSGVGSPVCLNKGDLFTVLAPVNTGFNPPHINLYSASKIAVNAPLHDDIAFLVSGGRIAANATRNRITTDLSFNWGNTFDSETLFHVYKFTPGPSSTYAYVAECSNRGVCNRATGVCNCFSGYTSDACSVQNSLAL